MDRAWSSIDYLTTTNCQEYPTVIHWTFETFFTRLLRNMPSVFVLSYNTQAVWVYLPRCMKTKASGNAGSMYLITFIYYLSKALYGKYHLFRRCSVFIVSVIWTSLQTATMCSGCRVFWPERALVSEECLPWSLVIVCGFRGKLKYWNKILTKF